MTLFDTSNSQRQLEVVELMTADTYIWKVEHFHELLQSKGLSQKPEEETTAILAMREIEKNNYINQKERARRTKKEKLINEEKAKRLAEVQQRRLESNAVRNPEKDIFLKARREKERLERQRRRDEKEANEAAKQEALRLAKQQQVVRMKEERQMRLSSQKIRIDALDEQRKPMAVHGSDEL